VRFVVAVSSPHMGLDVLPTSVAQPFAVTGWGLDSGVPSGTGVDHVQVWAYPHPGSGTPPVYWGTATLGQSRPDVAAVYGSQFATGGYQYTVSGETPGAYLLNVNVYYLSGTVRTQTRTIYVDTPTVPVTIDRQGMGTGAVSASGLACPGGAGTQGLPCGAAYPFNTTVTLTAVPDAGSAFGGWSGACSGSGACQVALDQARFVAALFTKTADTPTTSYYHVDAQGSVRAISDDSGAIVIRHDYYTFGEDAQPLTGDPLRYAGKELDPETAQEYFGARYYRNVWGRFGTVDPVFSSAAMADPQQWNRYAYARNNPLKFSDPLGAVVNCGDLSTVGCTDSINVSGDSYFVATYYAGGGGDTLDLSAVYHFDSNSGVGLSQGWCAEGYQPGIIYSMAHPCEEVPSQLVELAPQTQTSNAPSSDPPGDGGGGNGNGGGDQSQGDKQINEIARGIFRPPACGWTDQFSESRAMTNRFVSRLAVKAVSMLVVGPKVSETIGLPTLVKGLLLARAEGTVSAYASAVAAGSVVSVLSSAATTGAVQSGLIVGAAVDATFFAPCSK
jgi:RHS repeat-associated protein